MQDPNFCIYKVWKYRSDKIVKAASVECGRQASFMGYLLI